VVTEIRLDPAASFAKVMVQPSAKLEQSREVLLIWPHEHLQSRDETNGLADL